MRNDSNVGLYLSSYGNLIQITELGFKNQGESLLSFYMDPHNMEFEGFEGFTKHMLSSMNKKYRPLVGDELVQ